MKREVTMEAVFFAGFKAAFSYCLDIGGGTIIENGHSVEASPGDYYVQRNKAWLEYAKELEELWKTTGSTT